MSDLKTIWKKYSGVDKQELIILFSLAIGQSKEFILNHTDYKMSCWERWRLWRLVRRFKNGWPTAYLAGHKEFYGLDFLVNKNTLIPRSSTESMVELAVEQLRTVPARNASKLACLAGGNCERRTVLIDIGTGSGCIPIAITKALKHLPDSPATKPWRAGENIHPVKSGEAGLPSAEFNRARTQNQIKIIATDISRKALRVAEQNAKRHNVDIQFIRGDLLRPFIKNYSMLIDNCSLFITANLPYLTKDWIKSEPSIQKEPRSALLADNKHGLSLYEKLFQQIQFIILIFNYSLSIFIEIDARQSATAMELAKKYFPKAIIEIKKDLAGRDRILVIRKE